MVLMGAIRAFVTTRSEQQENGGIVSAARVMLYRACTSMLFPGALGEPESTGSRIIHFGWLFFALVVPRTQDLQSTAHLQQLAARRPPASASAACDTPSRM
jgi:hypothetical protein